MGKDILIGNIATIHLEKKTMRIELKQKPHQDNAIHLGQRVTIGQMLTDPVPLVGFVSSVENNKAIEIDLLNFVHRPFASFDVVLQFDDSTS